jgi:hypothetical protein
VTTAETVVPVCEGCGRSRPDAARRRVNGRRVCQRCWQAARVFLCPDCGAEKRIATAERAPDGLPRRCADCVTADEDLRRLVAIACHIDDVEPALPAEALVAAIETAAPTPGERAALAENLGFWPGSLVSGASTGTRVLWRLIVALEAAGATAVVRPRCADCDRPRELVAEPAWSKRICAPCERRRHAEPCARCDVVAVVGRRTVDGEALCRNCWHADPSSRRHCGRCGELGRINASDDDGTPVCMACYRDLQPHRRCAGCGRTGPVTSRHDTGDLCGNCYRHIQPRRRCGGCGRHTRIHKRARDDDPDLCAACNWAPVAVCSRCGDEAMCRHADNVGPPVCLRCLAIARLDLLLTRPTEGVPDPFVGVRDAFLAAHQPRSLMVWLDRSPGAVLLGRLATGEVELAHPALDALEQTPSLHHLRQLLVACGALPERDPQLALVELAMRRHEARFDDPHVRRTFRSYATWHELARLRRRHPDGHTPPLAAKGTKAALSQTARFLHHCHDHAITLEALSQADLDRWLADGPAARSQIRAFIGWSSRRGLVAPELEVATSRSEHYTTAALDPEERWRQARRMLHDNDLDPADRIVGALVLLYAQPLARIARLTIDDIHDTPAAITISFGKDDVLVPEPLGGLLRDLPWRRQIGPSGTVPGTKRWLFPGRQAGRHIHPEHLRKRLAALGIASRPARHAALLQLSREIPAAVLADMLNIDESTATAWAARSGGTWNDYAARRLAAPDP